MADTKISALPSATTPLAGTETLPIVQSSTTKQVSVANLTAGRDVAASSFKVGGSGTGAIYSPTPINCGAGLFSVGAGSNSANGNGPGAGFSADANGNINVYRGFWWQLGASDQAHLMLGNSTASAFNNPLTVTTDTNIAINTGNLSFATAGKGVNFTANTPAAGMTSQLLNWYEEGTWTPNQGSGLTVVGAFSSSGSYTRIGRLVTVHAKISGATSIAVGAVGQLSSNLPFTGSTPYQNGSGTNGTLTTSITVQVEGAAIYACTAVAATSAIYYSCTYFV